MPTYLYETIPAKEGGPTRQFEIRQSMKDAPLKEHPETGEPIRRVISAGLGVLTSSGSSASCSVPSAPRGHGGGCSCCH